MRSRAAHQTDKVPILLSRIGIALDISNKFREYFASRIKTERGFNLLVLQVAINCLGATNHLNTGILLQIVLSKHASIGIGIIATNDNDSLNAELFADLNTLVKLPSFFKLGATRTNDIKTAGIAIFVNNFSRELRIFMLNQAAGAAKKTIKFVLRIEILQAIKKTTNNVMTTGGLTTRKNHANVHRLETLFFALNHLDDGHSIRVREERLDFFLIGYRLRSFAVLKNYISLKGNGELWLIARTCNLERTFLHKIKLFFLLD